MAISGLNNAGWPECFLTGGNRFATNRLYRIALGPFSDLFNVAASRPAQITTELGVV
jgi:hypothetical protein